LEKTKEYPLGLLRVFSKPLQPN